MCLKQVALTRLATTTLTQSKKPRGWVPLTLPESHFSKTAMDRLQAFSTSS